MKQTSLSLMMLYMMYASLLFSNSNDQSMEQLAKSLNLYGGTKATIQWQRVFSSQRHLKRYKLEHLDQQTRDKLQHYLIQHAADSEQPIVPGVL